MKGDREIDRKRERKKESERTITRQTKIRRGRQRFYYKKRQRGREAERGRR